MLSVSLCAGATRLVCWTNTMNPAHACCLEEKESFVFVFQVFLRSRVRKRQVQSRGSSLLWWLPISSPPPRLPKQQKMMKKQTRRRRQAVIRILQLYGSVFLCIHCLYCLSYVQSKPAAAPEEPKKLNVPRAGQGRKRTPSASPDRTTAREGLSPTGQSQKNRELLHNTTSFSYMQSVHVQAHFIHGGHVNTFLYGHCFFFLMFVPTEHYI